MKASTSFFRSILTNILFIPAFSMLTYRVSGSVTDSLNAVHYEIRIHEIDFTGQAISATTTVWLTPFDSPQQSISLDLISLDVTGVWIDDVPVPSFVQGDSLVEIPLDEPLQPGDTLKARIDYHGTPFHESWGGFHFSGEYVFNLGVGISTIPHNLGKSWFPCVDNFTDRATYDVFCTLNNGKMAVCGGILEEAVNNGNGTTTYHWTLDQPVPTYLASIAAGNYVCVSDTFSGMERQIPIDIYVRPQDTNKVAGTFINLKEILEIFETCMGPYAWDRVGYTGTAIGAMEHATNIFVPHGTITGTLANEELMAHELTHMWMGDKVTCSSAEEMWINEGWATFFGMYYALALYGDENAFRDEMRAKLGGVMQYGHTPSGDGSYFPLNLIPQEYTYGMTAYDRGSTVVQALRFYLGDSLFFETVREFIDAFAFQAASSYDMRDFMSDYTGWDLSGFFDNWVLNAGTPHYSIDSFSVAPEGDAYRVDVYPRQKRKGPAFTGSGNIMAVAFMDQNWNRFDDTIHFDGASGHSERLLPFEPSVVLADPDEQMCDATTDQIKTIRAPGTYSFDKTFCTLEVTALEDSAFVQVTHNWAPPDSLADPIPGLRISDYRYWKVDGIFPAEFEATGKFFYSVSSFLDNTLITGSNDTLIMLYRLNSADEWHEVDFERVGPWNVGNILVPSLEPGEYSLAVKETGVGIGDEAGPERIVLEIVPNPSGDTFHIILSCENPGDLVIYSESGQVVDRFAIPAGGGELGWVPSTRVPGAYLVVFTDVRDRMRVSGKVIFAP